MQDASSHELTIPMPGHIVKGAEAAAECKATIAKLESLISEHDVIFLLLDSREARWLPTVLAAARQKVLLAPVRALNSKWLTNCSACYYNRLRL